MECITGKVNCDLNCLCSFIALTAGIFAVLGYVNASQVSGFWSIMQVVGMFAFITSFPSLIAILVGTGEYFGEHISEKNDPAHLLREAKLRLETEKILIEAEKLAEERREMVERHLHEQIRGAEAIKKILDDPRTGEKQSNHRQATPC